MAANADAPEMTASRPSLRRRFLDWFDWRINPVLLRDLRLYARGRLMVTSYLLTVAALALLAILYVLIARIDDEDGTGLLSILTGLLAVICGAMIPNLVFERFRAELANRATELALMSPLTPARLVRGKLVGAWCVSLLVVSAATPMIATAYLLGGVNIIGILGVVSGIVLAGLVMPTVQLFMASERRGKGLSRIIAGGIFGAQFLIMLGYASFLTDTFTRNPYRSGFSYGAIASMAVAGVLIAQFLYFATVARLRSESSARDAAPRISLAAAAVFGWAAASFVIWMVEASVSRGPDWEEVLGIPASVVAVAFAIGFVIVSYSTPVPSLGLATKWRKRYLRRLFFLPGIKSLSAYYVFCAGMFIGAVFLLNIAFGNVRSLWQVLCFTMAPLMAVGYGLVAYYYVVVRVARNKRNPGLLPTTIIVTNIALAIVSIFVIVLIGLSSGGEDGYLFLLASNPIGLYAGGGEFRRQASELAVFGLGFMFLLFCALLPPIFGNTRKTLGLVPEGDNGTR